MNFKNSKQLIAKVSKTLSSYKASGILNPGDFYEWIGEVLSLLNVPSFSPVHTIVEIENNKLAIPEDLYQVWALWKYDEVPNHSTQEPILQYTSRHPLVTKEVCLDKDRCTDECQIYEYHDILTVKHYDLINKVEYKKEYCNKKLLQLKNYTIEKCVADSPSIRQKSDEEVTMDSSNFYFNFKSGAVYLQYYTFMLDENGLPMIPDVAQIEKVIEAYLIFKFFQEAYWNNTFDALQRMQVAEKAYDDAYRVAIGWIKLPSVASMINIARRNKGKFKIYERV